MNITTTAQNFEMNHTIDRFVRGELQFALARFGEDILTADVFMKDTNGPKGGIDQQVVIRVRLKNGHVIATETTEVNMFAAARMGIKKTKRAVRRSIRRSRRVERTRLQDLRNNNGLLAVQKF